MAKWEIIEDIKFKKANGGKSSASRAVATKNSKNNPKMLSEVTVVEPKTVTKNKPVIQKPNVPSNPNIPAQDATRVNQPYYEKKVITNPNVVSYKPEQSSTKTDNSTEKNSQSNNALNSAKRTATSKYKPIQKPTYTYIAEKDKTKANVPVNERQVIDNQPTQTLEPTPDPTPLLNLSNVNSYNIPNLTRSDSLYYGVPYKNGEIADKKLWNENKRREQEEWDKKIRRVVDIGQTASNIMELFPPTALEGYALNALLTVPSVAMNYHDKNYAGMIPDAVGLVPGNILPPGVDLGKSVGEMGYNGYNVYQDFKQTGGKAAATRATINKFNTSVIKTPFSNLTPTSTYKEPSTVLIKDNRKINPVTNSPIKPTRDLKSGNYSAPVIDAIISQAVNNNVDPYKALAIGLQESGLKGNIGHVLDYTENSFGIDPEKLNQMTQEQKLAFTMVNAMKDKEEYAKKLGYSDDAHYLQAYNGFGNLTPRTEKKYHNSLGVGTNSFYGIDVTKNPINTAKNPVYGKTVLSLANMLKTNPTIIERVGAYDTFNNLLDKSPVGLIKQPFKNGGVIKNPKYATGNKVSGWEIVEDVPKAEKGLAVGERKILQRPTQPVQEKSVIKSIPTTVKPQYKSEGDYLNQVYGEDSGVQLPGQSSILRASQDAKPAYDVAKQDYSSYNKDFEEQKTDEQVAKFLKANPSPGGLMNKVNYIKNLSPADRQIIENSNVDKEDYEAANREYLRNLSATAVNNPLSKNFWNYENINQKAQGVGASAYMDVLGGANDFINPAYWMGNMAPGVVNIPYNLSEGNYGAAAMGLSGPLALAALTPGAKGFSGMANNLLNPLAGIVDANTVKTTLRKGVDTFHPVGVALKQIEKEGIANGLSAQEIKKLQLEKVGITSLQREGYFPGISEIASEYITPYSYDNAKKRILDVPRRIITGETNTKKLANNIQDVIADRGQNFLSEPRYDAWRMYSGLPQKYNTFRIAETTPLNHPSYTQNQLNRMELFSLNNEKRLLNSLPNEFDYMDLHFNDKSLVGSVNNLKNKLDYIQNLKQKGIHFPESDFNTTNVMGGHNQRFFNNKMEYNDIWDLNLNGLPVDKYYGKPFMSHGQLDYSFDPAINEINTLLQKAEKTPNVYNFLSKEKLDQVVNDYLNSFKNKNYVNSLNKNILTKKIIKKEGGIIEDPMGQWAHPGSVTRIPSNQITMQGVNYPVLGISDRGHTQMMYPGEDYSFRGKSVTEYPMMAGGGEVNFTYAGENHRVYEKESPTGNGKGIEGHIMVNHPTKNKGKWDTIDLTKITNGKVKTVAQGVASTKKWHKENPEYADGGMIKRADGSYSKRGLWDNIRDNAGSGKKPTKEMLKQERKIKSQYANGGQVSSWEIIEDLPKMQLAGKAENEKKALGQVQKKINEGYEAHTQYQKDVLAYAEKVKDSPDFKKLVGDYVTQKCGQEGGLACISTATKLLEGAGYPLGKGYHQNPTFQADVASGRLPGYTFTNDMSSLEPADLVLLTGESWNIPGNERVGHHMMPVMSVNKNGDSTTQFKWFGSQGNTESIGYHESPTYSNSTPLEYEILKKQFVDPALITTRDSLKNEIKKIDPTFDQPSKFKPRYTDYNKNQSFTYNPANYNANNPLDVSHKYITKETYKPLINNKEELMKKYNIDNSEFNQLVKILEGIGEQETKNGLSPRYGIKQIPGTQTLAKLFKGDIKGALDPGQYSEGPWQTKGDYVPKTDYERGSIDEAFATLVDRYKTQVPNKYKKTDYGYGIAVNKYKGMDSEKNDYVKNVLNYSKDLQVDGEKNVGYDDYLISKEKENPVKNPFQLGNYKPELQTYVPAQDNTKANTPIINKSTVAPKMAVQKPGQSVALPPQFKKGGKTKKSNWQIIEY